MKASIYSFPIKDIDIQLNLEPSERPFTANSLSSFPDYQASLFVNFQTYLMVDTVEYFGIRYNIGQIVAVKGKDGCIYYVEIRQLYLNEYNQKFFSFTWLHPSEEKASEEIIEKIEESNELHQFRRTSLHKAIESLDCIIGPIYD